MIALHLIALLALAHPVQRDKPIFVGGSSRDSSLHSANGTIPSYDMSSAWRSRSGKTYCVLGFDTLMELTCVTLTLKSKNSKGKWISSQFSGDNGSRDYFQGLISLSDSKAVVEQYEGPPAVFVRKSDQRWMRVKS
jgi:hypothetical protein